VWWGGVGWGGVGWGGMVWGGVGGPRVVRGLGCVEVAFHCIIITRWLMALKTFHFVQGLSRTPLLFIPLVSEPGFLDLPGETMYLW